MAHSRRHYVSSSGRPSRGGGSGAFLQPRSGLGAKKGLVCGNLLGLIDSDYQGPLSISLWNRSESEIVINPGERVAQLVVIRVNQVELDLVDEFTETERGNKGFGSTGVD